jgi:hypothetical protein
MPVPTSRTSVVRDRINRLKAGESPTTGQSKVVGGAADNNDATAVVSAAGFRARLRSAQTSPAGRGDLSVVEIRRQQAANDMVSDAELTESRRKAAAAIGAGKPHAARIYQQQIDRWSEVKSVSQKRKQ